MAQEDSSSVSAARPLIIVADARGLSVDTEGVISLVPWHDILLVIAAMVPHEGASMMLLTFETADGRVLILAESDDAWTGTAETLQHYLPTGTPFSAWDAALRQGASFTTVFEALT